jgi:sulfofructose kinase
LPEPKPPVSEVDLVGVGLNASDTVILVPEHPPRGSKIESNFVDVLPGGPVATAVIACQRWGLRTRYVGKLGDDAAAILHLKEFAGSGVEAQIITAHGSASQQAFILVDGQGERTVLWRRDQRLAVRPDELKREWIVGARALLVDGYDTSAATRAAEWARAAGIPVVADFDEAYPGIEDLMTNVDYLIVSRDFPQRFSGESNLDRSLPALERRFRNRLTAATLGRNGVRAWDGKQFHHARAYRVPALDTTGAGDIFHAGFIYGLLHGWPLERQLDFACAAAALNCMARGARGGIGSVEEVEQLMATGSRYPEEGGA